MVAEEKPSVEEQQVFKIPQENQASFDAKIAELNKKAKKLGMAPIKVTEVGFFMEPIKVRDPQTQQYVESGQIRRWSHVVIDGVRPVLNGWSFIGTLDYIPETGNVLRMVPNAPPAPSRYRDAKPWCEHCHSERYRKSSFLVHNETTNEIIQVGSSCIKDFLGHAHPENIARWCQYLSSFDPEDYNDTERGGGGGSDYAYDALRFMQYVAESYKRYGWVSRGKEKEAREYGDSSVVSTASDALGNLHPPKGYEHEAWRPTEESCQLGADTLNWVKETYVDNPEFEMSDYEHNLRVVFLSNYLSHRHLGIAASAIYAYTKHMNKQRASQQAGNSQHYGEVGKRYDLELTLTGSRGYTSAYGDGMIYSFVDENGNIFKWFTSNKNFVAQRTYKLTGTVKKHGDWNGICETVLTRCLVKD